MSEERIKLLEDECKQLRQDINLLNRLLIPPVHNIRKQELAMASNVEQYNLIKRPGATIERYKNIKPEWQQYEVEDLFPCWKCKKVNYSRSFNNSLEELMNERSGGYFQCCKICRDDMCLQIVNKDGMIIKN